MSMVSNSTAKKILFIGKALIILREFNFLKELDIDSDWRNFKNFEYFKFKNFFEIIKKKVSEILFKLIKDRKIFQEF